MRFPLLSAVPACLAFLLASCVGAPRQPPPPQPERAPAPGPAPSAPPPAPVEWQYRATTPGNWSYRTDPAGSSATFSAASAAPLVVLRCDRAGRRISLTRAGGGQGAMIIRTSYGAVSWPASASPAGMVATRAAADATLDQLAYSRGRFALEVAGGDMLILPVWAEVSRVIEDCRG